MHLKNFSLITQNNIVSLSPVYDLLNTTIAIGKATEELALPIKGRKNNITRSNILNYYGKEILGLNKKTIDTVVKEIQDELSKWHALIEVSFLSSVMKESYFTLLQSRERRLELI